MVSPQILREGWEVVTAGEGALLLRREGEEVAIFGLAARLFELADGVRDATTLAALTGAGREDIFAALDELAEVGLLTTRVAPPAAPRPRSRREVLQTIALAGLAASTLPRAAAAGEALPTAKPLGEQESKQLAASPPREQVFKEGSAKLEQQRKLAVSAWSEADEKAAAPLAAEEGQKAAAILLDAYQAAAKREGSPEEGRVKQEVGLDPKLAGLAEGQRKAEVLPLAAEEQTAKAQARAAELDLKASPFVEHARKLSAREQRAKLAGDFGDAHEQAHKRVVVARERRAKERALQDEEAKERALKKQGGPLSEAAQERRRKLDERLARDEAAAAEARAKADVDDARAQERAHKRALVTGEEAQRRRSAELHAKHAAAVEQRDKLEMSRLDQYHERQAERAGKRDEQHAKGRTDKAVESTYKAGVAELSAKDSVIDAELPGPSAE